MISILLVLSAGILVGWLLIRIALQIDIQAK